MLIEYCRLCGATEVEKLYARRFQSIEGVSFLDRYDVCVCKKCGFGFAGGIPAQAAFNRYYQDCSKYDGTVAYHARGAEYYAFFLRTLRQYIPDPEARILELGCAMGELPSALRDGGFTNVAGTDPSPKCAAHVSTALGIPCRAASIDDVDMPGSCDAVMAMSVLEHVCDLGGSVQKFASLLKDGGYLFIKVPDVMVFSTDTQPPFQEFSIEHINYFSAQSLANLAHLHGLEQITTLPAPDGEMLSVMRKTTGEKGIVFDAETQRALMRYISSSTDLDARIERRLAPYYGKALAVWGVGTFTRHLLANGTLARCDVCAFVDKNTKYHNGIIKNIAWGVSSLQRNWLLERMCRF